MKKIRVLVANKPRLMRELVLATIADQPDIEIVGETEHEFEVTELVERIRPDVLVLGLDVQEKRPALCGFLLGRYPEMRVLAVAPEKNSTIFFWAFLDMRCKEVESSEQGLLAALRAPSELLNPALPNAG